MYNTVGKLSSSGDKINWEKVWESYPFNRIDISPVLNEKKEYDLYLVNNHDEIVE